MELDRYNRSFEEHALALEEEAEARLRAFRQGCVRDLMVRLTKQQRDWEMTFRDILNKSQEGDQSVLPDTLKFTGINPSELSVIKEIPHLEVEAPAVEKPTATKIEPVKAEELTPQPEQQKVEQKPPVADTVKSLDKEEDFDQPDPCPPELHEYFTNISSVREFMRVQELLEHNRQQFNDINTNPSLKLFKNELMLLIRTQINTISNSDMDHLKTKIKLFTNLFTGQGVHFQDRFIEASKHPQGQLFAMDLAAQTFVTVGIRLVNSVPAIAKSMATVINGIVEYNLPIFKDLIIGHLQERCPYLIPMNPKRNDFSDQPDRDVKYMVACGYAYDSKSQVLESEEKYLIRMRSIVLIYACFMLQNNLGQAWTWLVSFLSLKPRPVITATVLQAFLQEASKDMSSKFGRQYKKLIEFIKLDYLKMIEEVTPKGSERQPLIKLQNLLSDDTNLLAAPKVSSLFGAVRF